VKLINLTPHRIVLLSSEGPVTLEPDAQGRVVRAEEIKEVVGEVTVDGVSIPLVRMAHGKPSFIPELGDDEVAVVSVIAARALVRERPDLRGRVVAVGELIRDDSGRVLGAKSLVVVE